MRAKHNPFLAIIAALTLLGSANAFPSQFSEAIRENATSGDSSTEKKDKAEREFLQNLIKGKIEQYSYHYKKVLKKRILDKRKELTEDIHLITKAEDKLQSLKFFKEPKEESFGKHAIIEDPDGHLISIAEIKSAPTEGFDLMGLIGAE